MAKKRLNNFPTLKKFGSGLLVTVLMMLAFTANAQPTDPGEGDCGLTPDDPCQLPLDTWVYVLVIAAVIYGAYRMHQKQKAFTV